MHQRSPKKQVSLIQEEIVYSVPHNGNEMSKYKMSFQNGHLHDYDPDACRQRNDVVELDTGKILSCCSGSHELTPIVSYAKRPKMVKFLILLTILYPISHNCNIEMGHDFYSETS